MAIFASVSLVSTPAMAADAYVLQDNNGNQIHAFELSQSEAREILRENAERRGAELPENHTYQDIFKAKADVNADFQQSVAELAQSLGMAPQHANSVSNALKYSYGRDILNKSVSMSFEGYEFNPDIYDRLLNGPTPTATSVFANAGGQSYRACGIATPDSTYTAEDWYAAYTGTRVSDEALNQKYDDFMMTENHWQLKANCFFLEEAYYADYYGTLQMLNESYGTDQYQDVVEYLTFKADMWMYMRIEQIVTTGDSRLFAQAKIAALRDFEAHGQKVTEQDIWTLATSGTDLNGAEIATAASSWDEDIVERSNQAADRQRDFIARNRPAL